MILLCIIPISRCSGRSLPVLAQNANVVHILKLVLKHCRHSPVLSAMRVFFNNGQRELPS